MTRLALTDSRDGCAWCLSLWHETPDCPLAPEPQDLDDAYAVEDTTEPAEREEYP